MSDDEEQQSNSNSISSQNEIDHRRRLSEIKGELQGLMRQKKKYDEEKLRQESDFLQSEIHDLRNSISVINKEINDHTQTKKKLHVNITNLRSRSRLRYTNLANALREKRRYEAELKKANKNEEYRELARGEIRSIDTAVPILQKEEEYKTHLKQADDAQQAATGKRTRLEDNLNNNLRKQTEIKQLLGVNADKLPQIEATIESLRCEREQLLSLSSSSSTHGKRSRRRLSSNQPRLTDSPTTTDLHTPIRSLASLEEDCLEYEKTQHEDQLSKVNTLINYFREKLIDHGLNHEPPPPSHPITPSEEQSILSSYMKDHDDHQVLSTKNEPTDAIAMKLPRNFAPLNLNLTTTNEIVHAPFADGNEFEYKKEFSSDILDKYGGQSKKTKQQQQSSGKKHKRNKKTFGITHNPQMIALYDTVRGSTGSSDTLPSLPMYEYELQSTIQSLEFFKQSLDSYLNELSMRSLKISMVNGQQQHEDEDIRDSALDTVSEASSLIEPVRQILQSRLSTSSDEKKTLPSSPPPPSSNHSDSKKLTTVDELNSRFQPISTPNPPMDRQTSDEGYRSVQNEQQLQQGIGPISNHNSPLLTRSKSYDCTEKVGQWLSSTSSTSPSSSLPRSLTYQTDFQV